MARLHVCQSVPALRLRVVDRSRSKNVSSPLAVSVAGGPPRARASLVCPLRGGAVQGLCRWCGGGRGGGVARAVGIRIVDAGASEFRVEVAGR